MASPESASIVTEKMASKVHGYPVFDSDSHALLNPKMWEDLPVEYAARCPGLRIRTHGVAN
jgi:hypothetical protein